MKNVAFVTLDFSKEKQEMFRKILGALFLFVLILSVGAGPKEDAQAFADSKDFVSELKIINRYALSGEPWAQTRLGYMYYYGQALEVDFIQAASWFRKAAEKGYAEAQRELGYIYSWGGRPGVPV